VLNTLDTYTKDLLHLFFPNLCEGCGSDVVEHDQLLCLQCMAALPVTGFFQAKGNPIEKTFYGRLALQHAGAAYYFTGNSLMQHLVTELKYKGNKAIGEYLGRMTGIALLQCDWHHTIDAIVPLPLNAKKLQKRGYNQAAVIAGGLATILQKPVLLNAVERKIFTETQTKKDRISRWQTMQEVFSVKDAAILENKQVLLVDDIVTTGATLEACGTTMLKVPGLKLSIATVAWTI
jgi:ComF family protein